MNELQIKITKTEATKLLPIMYMVEVRKDGNWFKEMGPFFTWGDALSCTADNEDLVDTLREQDGIKKK